MNLKLNPKLLKQTKKFWAGMIAAEALLFIGFAYGLVTRIDAAATDSKTPTVAQLPKNPPAAKNPPEKAKDVQLIQNPPGQKKAEPPKKAPPAEKKPVETKKPEPPAAKAPPPAKAAPKPVKVAKAPTPKPKAKPKPKAVAKPKPKKPVAKANRVIFTLNRPGASSVKVDGGFVKRIPRALQKGANGVWSLTLFINPGTYTYSFVVDGKRILDPDNPLIDPAKGENILLVDPRAE